MATITVTLSGQDLIAQTLRQYAQRYPKETLDAIYEEGLALEAESVPLVPVEHGRLKSSHFVERRAGHVAVGYGGPSNPVDYAVYVHERTELRHAVGEDHFLEKPFLRRMSGYWERLAARIRARVGR